MRSERWEPDKSFKEISVDLLNPSAWKHVEQGKWFYKDAIQKLEARTLTKACDRLGNVSNFMEFKVFEHWATIWQCVWRTRVDEPKICICFPVSPV